MEIDEKFRKEPGPDDVRKARLAAGLTQAEALKLVSYLPTPSYRTWQTYEARLGTKEHRQIPFSTWTLFLLLTEQHPGNLIAAKD